MERQTLIRIFDPVLCRSITDLYPEYFTFDVESWIANPRNYAVMSDDNIAFAEYKQDGVYWVHFCFNSARGRDAITLTKAMFDDLCKTFPLKIAIGLISIENKKACWLIRQVGFKSLGTIDTENGVCEMFYQTTKENTDGFQ